LLFVVVARAIVPKMNLDELFEQKGEVAKGVMEELGKVIFTAFIKSYYSKKIYGRFHRNM